MVAAATQRSLCRGGETAGLAVACSVQVDRTGRPVPPDPPRCAGCRSGCCAWRMGTGGAPAWRGHGRWLDLLPMGPIPGATLLPATSTTRTCRRGSRILGGKADLVLSDMAPNTTGHAATDHLRIMALAELAAAFAREVLAAERARSWRKFFRAARSGQCWRR